MGKIVYTNRFLHKKAKSDGRDFLGQVLQDVYIGSDRILLLQELSSETDWSVDAIIRRFIDFGLEHIDRQKGPEENG